MTLDQFLAALQQSGQPITAQSIANVWSQMGGDGGGGKTTSPPKFLGGTVMNRAPDLIGPPVGELDSYPSGTDQRARFLRGTPGYGFAFDEGMRAIQSSAASKGTLLTGGTLRGLSRYGTGMADQLYGNTVDRYARLAELGQKTATSPF